MGNRHLLHKNKLELFKEWLVSKGYTIQDTKGYFEALRAKKDLHTIVIFYQLDASEHLTVLDKDCWLVMQFIKWSRKNKIRKAVCRESGDI